MHRNAAATVMGPDDISIGSFVEAARKATGTAVIIDVFRAFTTAAVALANGAARIIMVGDLETALALRERKVGRFAMGERHGLRPRGFDFGNSPAEILGVRLDVETLIQTTSNGTRGVLAAGSAKRIYAGSLVTAEATVRAILKGSEAPVSLIAMGEAEQRRADEDELCAFYLRSRLIGRHPDPEALCRLIRTMSRCADSENLSREDVDCCLALNAQPFAIRVSGEKGHWVATAE